MLPLDFTEDDVYGTAGVLGAESIELRNWLVFLGYTSEYLRVVVTILDEWMSNSSPSWAAYRALMDFRLVSLDKRPWVCPVGIRETLYRPWIKSL